MEINPDRWFPLKSMVLSIIFPGYFYWRDNKKIEGLSISVAVLFGYLVIIGIFLHIFCLYKNWQYSQKYNQKWGYEIITEKEEKTQTIMGVIGGIFGHPVFHFITLFWLFQSQFYQLVDGLVKFNILAILFVLLLIFSLRYFLFYAIYSLKIKESGPDHQPIFVEFAKNNSPLIFLFPSYLLIINPISSVIFTLYLYVILPLGVIIGSRVLYNNIRTFQNL